MQVKVPWLSSHWNKVIFWLIKMPWNFCFIYNWGHWFHWPLRLFGGCGGFGCCQMIPIPYKQYAHGWVGNWGHRFQIWGLTWPLRLFGGCGGHGGCQRNHTIQVMRNGWKTNCVLDAELPPQYAREWRDKKPESERERELAKASEGNTACPSMLHYFIK